MRRPAALLVFAVAGCGPGLGAGADEQEEADGRTLVHAFDNRYQAPPRVDIILVIDDSPSMRTFQPNWAANLGPLAAIIDAPDVEADVRIAITTTSVPGPTCSGTRALGGAPTIESCRAHLDDFVGPDEHGEQGGAIEDLRALCQDACSLDTIPRIPSLGHDDHDLASLAIRPWIEAANNPFGGNLDGVSLGEALTCAGLQGFRGCTFESPIEAAARMVERIADPSDPMFEFRRADASLYIVIISDEDDCSHPDAAATIFDPDGERTFWPDAAADHPTSGICARAGLECDDQTCWLADHALDGTITDDPASAALMATTRLHDALTAAGELSSRSSGAEGEDPAWAPTVAVVGGFTSNGNVDYSPTSHAVADEQIYVEQFGVRPGCSISQPGSTPDLHAAPGGRLAAAASEDATFSICEDSYEQVFEGFANSIKPQEQLGCIPFECVADLDPDQPLLQPDCVVEEVDYADARIPLPPCTRDENGWVIDPDSVFSVPADAHGCWVWLTDVDGQGSSDPNDDMTPVCVDAGMPSGFGLVRGPVGPLPYDSEYQLRCRPCEED